MKFSHELTSGQAHISQVFLATGTFVQYCLHLHPPGLNSEHVAVYRQSASSTNGSQPIHILIHVIEIINRFNKMAPYSNYNFKYSQSMQPIESIQSSQQSLAEHSNIRKASAVWCSKRFVCSLSLIVPVGERRHIGTHMLS